MTGVVRDPAGLPLEGARVEVVGLGTSQRTGADGVYQFLDLPAGEYRVEISREGFRTLRREGLAVRAGERVVMDFELGLGEGSERMEVTGAPPLLQAARGAVGFAVEQRKVVSFPLDGRNFVPLMALSPGVSLPPGSLLPRINGSRPRVSEYIYDGISVLQPEPGQVAYYPILDAIAEFRVETNSYSAEYGRSNGGVILVNQKVGTNAVHGTLFSFFRNEKLNARNLFASTGDKPRFRRNQYGFVLGGPVQRDRTFFFVAWQGTRLNTGVVRVSTVPTLAERRGEFSSVVMDPGRGPFAGNVIPVSRFDRVARELVKRYPVPNVVGAVGNNYRRVGNENTESDQFDGRLDRYFGTRQRVFGRYSSLREENRPVSPLPDGSGNVLSGVTTTRADSLAGEHTWNRSANAVNQLRFGYTTRRFERASLRGSAGLGIPNVPVSSFGDVLPTFDVVGWQQIGPSANGNARFMTSVTQLIDMYAGVRGGHSWKVGMDLRWARLDVLQPANPTGSYQFSNLYTGNSVASFLLGQVARFSIDLQPTVIRPRARLAEFFGQDDWRISRRWSVNAGVRYTLNFPSTVVGGGTEVFNLVTERMETVKTARNLEALNFAPRLGVAYKVEETLVLRAGYGMTWIEQAGITTPFTTPLFPLIQTLGQQALDNSTPAFVLSAGPGAGAQQGVFGVQRDNGSGYAQQWNLSVQKTWGEDWSGEVGYLGSKLTRLGVPDVNLNQLRVEQLGAERRYPQFNTVALYRNNVGHSTYHSLQARVEKRFSRGLTFTGAYTFSRLIDDAGAVFDSAVLTGPAATFQMSDSYNKRLEKDVSTGNVPHNFSAGFVYERRGWQWAGIGRAQSGSPVPVTQATNFNAFAGFGIQRPDRLRDPALEVRSVGRWFDTGAFRGVGAGRIGNSSRNPAVGPGYRAVDLMMGRTFRLRERLRLEVRAEAFNVANTPPLGNPNGSFGTVAFGTITTALDPRVFELVMKVSF